MTGSMPLCAINHPQLGALSGYPLTWDDVTLKWLV